MGAEIWIKVQDLGTDIGQLRHKLGADVPRPFVLPMKKWVHIDRESVLAQYGYAARLETSEQGYLALKKRGEKKPAEVAKLLAHADAQMAAIIAYAKQEAEHQPEKWFVSLTDPAGPVAKASGVLDRLKGVKGGH